MRVAKILAGCTYGPETRKIIGKAFDDAWASIADDFAGDAQRADAARERLAHAVLIAATENCRDPEPIKTLALQIMALSYRGSWLDPGGNMPN
jgi:cation transport regulator ChaB